MPDQVPSIPFDFHGEDKWLTAEEQAEISLLHELEESTNDNTVGSWDRKSAQSKHRQNVDDWNVDWDRVLPGSDEEDTGDFTSKADAGSIFSQSDKDDSTSEVDVGSIFSQSDTDSVETDATPADSGDEGAEDLETPTREHHQSADHGMAAESWVSASNDLHTPFELNQLWEALEREDAKRPNGEKFRQEYFQRRRIDRYVERLNRGEFDNNTMADYIGYLGDWNELGKYEASTLRMETLNPKQNRLQRRENGSNELDQEDVHGNQMYVRKGESAQLTEAMLRGLATNRTFQQGKPKISKVQRDLRRPDGNHQPRRLAGEMGPLKYHLFHFILKDSNTEMAGLGSNPVEARKPTVIFTQLIDTSSRSFYECKFCGKETHSYYVAVEHASVDHKIKIKPFNTRNIVPIPLENQSDHGRPSQSPPLRRRIIDETSRLRAGLEWKISRWKVIYDCSPRGLIGPPLRKLCGRLTGLSSALIQAWRQSQQMGSWLGFCDRPLQPGKQRVHWVCRCGAALYDDYVVKDTRGFERIHQYLRQFGEVSNSFEHGQQAGKQGWSFGLQRALSSLFGRASNSTLPGPVIPMHNTHASATSPHRGSSVPEAEAVRLLSCVKSGRFGADLYQDRIEGFRNDRDLFAFLKRAFLYRRRRLWSILSFRAPEDIGFIKFHLVGELVDVRKHEQDCSAENCSCLPPQEKTRPPDPEYSCNPLPPPVTPPVGSELLMHLLYSPHCLNEKQKWILQQFPKKLQGKLEESIDGPTEAWGIHLKEGWDWDKLRNVLLAYVLGSIIIGVVWTWCRDDIQGGFGTAAYLISTATVFFGYVAMRPV